MAAPLYNERLAPPAAPGAVAEAIWWTPLQVEVAPGRWCPKPFPHASLKPELPRSAVATKAGSASIRPLMSAEFARRHASPDNMLIVTYVNQVRATCMGMCMHMSVCVQRQEDSLGVHVHVHVHAHEHVHSTAR